MVTNDLTKELGQNFIEYAVEVNSDRAIPDSKSGLKPVAKRILWGAQQMGAASSKPHVKAATIVGEVMGKYHPHGDSSIYGAMVRLSQEWVMRYPLIDWHGSKGNILGDGPAASRYTEARLSKLAEEGLLEGIKKKNVEFTLNFSDSLDEPVTLPSIFPNLLCNPNTGIGVAMACNWAPHNLKEVAQAIYDYMDGQEPMLPGPDFPTGGVIINKDDIPKIMKTGHGSVKVRGKYKVEKQNIVFYEIPYGLTIESLLDEIAGVCDAKEIEGINRIYDDSNKKGIRLIIECDKGVDPDVMANKLFAKTSLQSSFSYNQVALIDKTPTELNLKDCIKVYIDHNIDCIKREVQFDLNKAEARLHIVDGLLKAFEDIDNIIALIKKSESAAVAKIALMAKYGLDEIQAQAILDMKLAKLAKLEKVELENEQKELISKIEGFNNLLQSTDLQLTVIKEKLANIVRRFGDDRRTDLAQIEVPKEKKEKPEIVPEDCVVVITQSGLVKRIPTKAFKASKRNTVGVKTGDDIIAYSIKTNTVDTLMVFSDAGKMYRISVNDIPEGTNVSRGLSLRTLAKMSDTESPMAYSSLANGASAGFIFFATKNGIVKKVPMNEYDSMKKTGIIAIKLKERDALAAVTFIDKEDIMLVTKNGQVIKFATADMPLSSRVAQGVKGMAIADSDEVVAALPIGAADKYLVIVTENCLGKRVDINEFTTQNRGGKGVICSKSPIAGAVLVGDSDSILVCGDRSSVALEAKSLSALGRVSAGVVTIKNNDKVVSIARI